MKITALNEHHKALGAKMVEFGGWEMPLHYGSILQEHKTVRASAGVFDVSHMGRVSIVGPEAEKLLDLLSTNIIAGKKIGTATYTVWCNELGGCVDDLIVYRISAEEFYTVFNASNRDKDLNHLLHFAKDYHVTITDHYEKGAILAVQGPDAAGVLSELFPTFTEMGSMQVQQISWQGHTLYLSTTGYTGAGGAEICGDNVTLVSLWEALMGKGIAPIGLGARDTLRLEMGYALYGHEISEKISPTESVSRWVVKRNKNKFIGKQALDSLENHRRYPAALVVQEKGIAREGASLILDGIVIGRITSGTFSPTLGKAIALALVDRHLPTGSQLSVEMRGQTLTVEVVQLPFLNKS